MEPRRTLAGHRGIVGALLFVGGRLVSGSDDRSVRVWDVAARRCQCEGVLEGHGHNVTSLAVGGGRLLSGSYDGTVRVWAMEGDPSGWRCERVLEGDASGVWCLAAWGGRVACGCGDGGVRVWSSETWALERTLRGRAEGVDAYGLAAEGRWLFISHGDGSVRVWCTETWECVQTAEAYPAGSRRYIECLAVCGPTLVGGAYGFSGRTGEVRVWDLETLAPLHTLAQAAACDVCALVCEGAEVWGAVGRELVVWGRRAPL
jgi:WD40 repeat protein